MLNGGGGAQHFVVVLTRELKVLAILMGPRVREKSFHSLKGGTQKVLDLRFSNFVALLPVINDRSLNVIISTECSTDLIGGRVHLELQLLEFTAHLAVRARRGSGLFFLRHVSHVCCVCTRLDHSLKSRHSQWHLPSQPLAEM